MPHEIHYQDAETTTGGAGAAGMRYPSRSRVRAVVSPLFAAVCFCATFASAPASAAADERAISFNRDIRPIMSDTCFLCHGFDASTREAGLRLDLRDEALKPTKNGVVPIVPGNPEESEVILRITDDIDPMPPLDAHKRLTPEQKELFRRWIAEGAVYEPHWAYAPLPRPNVPAPPGTMPAGRNPIDAFIRAQLAAKQITPSPEAGKAQLLRRLALDLTGLPPTPQEVAAFLADKSPDAYEKQVERLFNSPRHGERMAVWWLDLARFTDTVGFHGDQNQRIFPYRDYVIDAFNANKRFDRFTVEQLAGDLLPNPTPDQIVATGYNRLNMMTREGGAQPKEYLAKYGAERVRSVAAAWFGSTFGCAECHDHKFDPIKAQDFYELQAFFADVKQWGVYHDYNYTPNPELAGFSNDHPFPPEIEVQSPYLRARKQRLERELATHLAGARNLPRQVEVGMEHERWIEQMRAFLEREPTGWSQPPLSAALLKGGSFDSEVAVAGGLTVRLGERLRAREALRITLQPEPGPIAALRVDAVEATDPDGKPNHLRNVLKLAASVRAADGTERKLEFIHADASAMEPYFLDGEETIGLLRGWKLPRTASGAPFTGVWLLAQPVTLAAGEKLVLTLNGEALPGLRFYTSPLAALAPLESAAEPVRAALAVPRKARTPEQKALLFDAWLFSTAWERDAFRSAHRLAAKIRETRDGRAWTMVTQAAAPLTVRVLPRGNWQDESGPVVLPATPSFLPARQESAPDKRLTRLDLAQWILSDANPITARAVMNRLWAMYFGTGLSAALDDLGSQGEAPSHPELLDWLASEFRGSGWDLRHMMRLIVTSATYRQSSSLRPELRDLDPANRLLASQNPRRLEAEFVRDNALFIAGALNLAGVGGPSVKPYQPDGYYAALQFPNRDYVASDDDEQWRRGVYMHWQRTFLHPMLANFDAPARDECAAQRIVSNTPQQALTLLNDPTFVEAARLFAARLVAEAAGDESRLVRAYRLALGREPKPAERESLRTFLAQQRTHYAAHRADAEKLLHVGLAPRPPGDAAELAAWTSVARVLLNSHEAITRY
jgi:hypothetical protein